MPNRSSVFADHPPGFRGVFRADVLARALYAEKAERATNAGSPPRDASDVASLMKDELLYRTTSIHFKLF